MPDSDLPPVETNLPRTMQDVAVSRSTTVNGLASALRVIDPTLAKQIEGVSVVGSRTIWVLIATPLVSWVSARYLASSLDAETQALLAGLVAAGMTALAGIIMRCFFTVSPVTSVLPKPVTAPPDVAASDPVAQRQNTGI